MMTVADLRKLLDGVPDELVVMVPNVEWSYWEEVTRAECESISLDGAWLGPNQA